MKFENFSKNAKTHIKDILFLSDPLSADLEVNIMDTYSQHNIKVYKYVFYVQ